MIGKKRNCGKRDRKTQKNEAIVEERQETVEEIVHCRKRDRKYGWKSLFEQTEKGRAEKILGIVGRDIRKYLEQKLSLEEKNEKIELKERQKKVLQMEKAIERQGRCH